MPVKAFNRVDLPAPLGPTTASRERVGTLNDRWSRMLAAWSVTTVRPLASNPTDGSDRGETSDPLWTSRDVAPKVRLSPSLITADVETELATLGPNGRRPLRSR